MNKICEHDQKFDNDEHKHGELCLASRARLTS